MKNLQKMKLIFFLKYNYFLPVSEAVASVTEAVLAAAVEPAIAAIIKKIMYIKICTGNFFYNWHLSVYIHKICLDL